jgi:MoaA/NifB/PqqE/SkfB family radical SAM enzyme
MRQTLPVLPPQAQGAPTAPFVGLDALWIQLTGTWCNLECSHCLNASGPRDPWLKPLAPAVVRVAIAAAERLGVREIYFTGGEPFLHAEAIALIGESLAVAATTVLTNGTLVDDATAEALGELAAAARYSLEVRVSLDDPDRARNDAIRGRGSFDRALRAIRRLEGRGLLPILTATEVDPAPIGETRYDRLRHLLLEAGVRKPRVKMLPLLPVGRMAGHGGGMVTPEMLQGIEPARLQCSDSRAVAAGGIYACPILAGLPEARVPASSLAEALTPTPLSHPACLVCWQTGASCRNA